MGGTTTSRGRRLAVATVVVGVLALAWTSLPADTSAELLALIERIRAAGPVGAIAFVGLHLVASLLMVPGSWPQMAAGFLYGPVLGGALGSVSSTLCAAVAFGLARSWLRGPLERRFGHDARLKAIDLAVDRGGAQLVALLRLSPVAPYSVITYLLGLTRVRLADFVVGSWVGNLPSVALYAWIGSTAKDLAELWSGDGGGGLVQIVGLVLTIVATALVTRVARRALRDAIPSEAT